ncbi:hypothetical protein [Streptomyces kanamyceticus]|uniref:Lipoprotein n=1 Tax=Streptomyces kanamyceticus TaxID=1967 RepID=A0A5J6GFW4_STRKN|nr:hypothetical protein [Streptomyces kanamyceticus]QEU92778.1 hypothetical protein CP970_19340 [Streptomyces kanamyceticus]
MSIHTTPGAAARLRVAGLVALPVLMFSAACGGGGGDGAKDAGVASVPDESATGKPADSADSAKDSADSAKKHKSAFYDAQVKYVRCMRGKAGVKDFPDPELSGYLDMSKVEKVVDPNGNGEEYKGGKDGACVTELKAAMNLEPERDDQKDYESMLAHAKCMREKGVSKFTNPTMSGGNVLPGGDPSPANPQLDRDSATYKEARTACKDKLLDGLDGMQ